MGKSKHKFVNPKNGKWRGQSVEGYKPYKKKKKGYDPDESLRFIASLHGKTLEEMKAEIEREGKAKKLKKYKKYEKQKRNREEQSS